MKAEHRKELQTNTLADSLGKWIQGLKHAPSASSTVVYLFIALVIGVFVVWWVYYEASKRSRLKLWREVAEASTLSDLEDVSLKNRGTVAARVARFQRARLLSKGVEQLYAPSREQALKDVEEAELLYQALAKESVDIPLLAQEALLGMAEAQEARGKLDEARASYEKLAKLEERYPYSPHVQTAVRRLKDLKDSGTGTIHDKLTELTTKKQEPDKSGPDVPPAPEKPSPAP